MLGGKRKETCNIMKMNGFRNLLDDMRRNEKKHEQFGFEYNHVAFDTIFRIDSNPYELLIGAIGHSFSMVLPMLPGFIVNIPYDDYRKLCSVLNLHYNSNHFSSADFLAYISNHAPKTCSRIKVQPHQIARYQTKELRNVKDSEKIYFVCWNDHTKDGRKAQNFEKTRILLGDKTAEYCIKHNISSCWSDISLEVNNYQEPWQ